MQKIEKNDQEIEKYEDTQEKIVQITNYKKQLLKELNKIEQILGQSSKLKNEYEEKLNICDKAKNDLIVAHKSEIEKEYLQELLSKSMYGLKNSST